MGILERSLEEDVARLSRSKIGATSDSRRPSMLPGQEESYSDQEDDEDTRDLSPSIMATEEAVYCGDDADDNDDDILDLGIAMGKVRITERIGGLVRPRFSEEVNVLAPQQLSSITHIVSSLLKRSASCQRAIDQIQTPWQSRTLKIG